MNKKNRFAMLEVDPKGKDDSKASVPINDGPRSEQSQAINRPKVIVADEDFEINLKHHKLKIQVKELQHKKKVIESRIFRIKRDAWIKIILGIFIIATVARKYIWGDRQTKNIGNNQIEVLITKATFSTNDFLIVILILIFIYYQFFTNKKK